MNIRWQPAVVVVVDFYCLQLWIAAEYLLPHTRQIDKRVHSSVLWP